MAKTYKEKGVSTNAEPVLALHEVVPEVAPKEVVAPAPTAAPSLYINREVSWLAFNKRVLEEAWDERYPLLERVKFLAIFGSNLDEFFMIRVSGLQVQRAAGVADLVADGMTPTEALAEISRSLDGLLKDARHCWTRLSHELLRERIDVHHYHEIC